jgi:hypothetical protein
VNHQQTKHLELIQSVISRLASNSFALKGWSVTVTAALLALAAKESNLGFGVVAFYPAVAFWGLDAYYLRQERRFRALYDAVRLGQTESSFTMDPAGTDSNVESWWDTLWSGTIAGVHLPILAAIIGVLLYAKLG